MFRFCAFTKIYFIILRNVSNFQNIILPSIQNSFSKGNEFLVNGNQ